MQLTDVGHGASANEGQHVKKTLRRIALSILCLGVLVSCRSSTIGDSPPARPANELITQGTPQSVKAFKQRALEVAKQWRPDAYMFSANAIVPALKPDGTFIIDGRVSLDFRSKTDTQHSYRVGFDSKGTSDVFEFSDAIPQSDDLPIESIDWPLDSIDAWRIVLANGGSTLLEEYRQSTIDMRCSASLHRWNPQLKPSGTGRVLWHITCIDAVTEKSFHFLIDAQTGEVVDKR